MVPYDAHARYFYAQLNILFCLDDIFPRTAFCVIARPSYRLAL